MTNDSGTRLLTCLAVGLGGAVWVAGALALAGAGAAILHTPEGFQKPAVVFLIFSRIFLGYFVVAAPVAWLTVAAVRLLSRGAAATAERALPVVVAVLLSVAAILDQAFALDSQTLAPAAFGWSSALLGVCAAIGVAFLVAWAIRGERRLQLARAATIFLPLGVMLLAVLVALRVHLRPRLAESSSQLLALAALSLAGIALTAGLCAILARLESRGRRIVWFLVAIASGGILAAPLAPAGRRVAAAPRLAASPSQTSRPVAPRPGGPGAGARNVILISIDTLRADRLSCYGNPRRTSPAIDTVAAEGVRFEYAFSTSSWTLPSHASMLTGLYPSSHGADRARVQTPDRKIDPLNPNVPTLAAEMRRRGYLTAGFVSNAFMSSAFGLNRGFDEFHDRIDRLDRFRSLQGSLYWRAMMRLGIWTQRDFDAQVRVDEILPEQIRWIQEHAEHPFFLFLHYMEPHHDYEPPEKYRLRADGSAIPVFREMDLLVQGRFSLPPDRLADLAALYDGEIAYLDDHLSELFAAIDRAGLRESTLLVITSDHGESLGEHGLWTHGDALAEEQIRVPLILRLPGVIPAGVVVQSGLASHVDLMPTILDLTGGSDAASLQGQSLRSLWEGGPSQGHRAVYAEIRSDLTWRSLNPAVGGAISMLRTATAKFVLHDTDDRRLYLLREDPGEEENVLASHPDTAREMELALRAWKERTQPAGESSGSSLDAATIQQLRALGYLR